MVRHVIKVYSDGLLVEKLDAFDTNLGVLRLILLLLRHRVVGQFRVLRLDSRAVDAGSLVRFIYLCSDDLIQADLRFLMVLTELCELLNMVVLCSDFERLKKF